jgi:ElaB/YqjD/DUF883 family membrane-anchored ribosome-binding protein
MKATNTGSEHVAGATVNRMASGAHEAVDRIADATNNAADSLNSKGREIKALEERWLEKVRDYVEHNPVQSLGIALASGYLLSRIISNR